MLLFARALKDKGVPVPEIAKKLTIKTGKNAGQHPSVASVYRALADGEQAEAPSGPDTSPRTGRPGPTSPAPAAPPTPSSWTASPCCVRAQDLLDGPSSRLS
jgi:hypothetical protein